MATKNQVIALHQEHPSWTARRIAFELGCRTEYVRATARRESLKLAPIAAEDRKQVFKLGVLAQSLDLNETDLRRAARRDRRAA